MYSAHYYSRAFGYLFIISTYITSTQAQAYQFSTCGDELDGILNGTFSKGNINQHTVQQYLWHGPILGLKSTYSRGNITALTYNGCLAVCGNHTETRSTRSSLEITATWIFPLAILFNLPYDSVHRKKVRTTFSAVLNWVGSPQTALTHTIFNIRQIRNCHRYAKTGGGVANDAFYTLSCLGQFEIDLDGEDEQRFYEALIFGLFRPLSGSEPGPERDQQEYTTELLSAIAFQLRMLRRRGVIPTLSSLGIFLVAFVFSIVLAFGDLEGNRTGSPLTLGLLYCWLPLLVTFTIIDRNPVSADRTAVLMSRWLFNVNAVMDAAKEIHDESMPKPQWWRPRRTDDESSFFKIGKFIGQGRQITYSGLADAVIRAKEQSRLGTDIEQYERCARQAINYTRGKRPGSWFVTAIAALLMVWIEVMMALLVAIFTPTYGLGCWSASLLLFGILSSLTWTYQFVCKSPGPNGRMLCELFNLVSFCWMLVLTGLALVGGFKNCYCSTGQLSSPAFGGYMMFKSFEFYWDHFHMEVPWIIASAVGGFVPLAVFITAILWWMKCQHLWTTEETGMVNLGNNQVHSDTVWLAA